MTSILVVDDSAMDRRIAGGLLERNLGCEVVFACDGQEALDRLSVDRPDLIVTDLQMPNVNGLELVRETKRRFPLIPVVLMTAQGSETIAVQALEEGAASYVTKSELSHDLCDIVQRVISVASERRSYKLLMQRMQELRFSFVLDNDPGVLTSMVGYVSQLLNETGLLAEGERLRVGVALEEALLNAAYHGNLEVSSVLRETDYAAYYELARERSKLRPYCDRKIQVDVQISADHVRYVIQDEGPGFDPSSLPDPTDPANLERPCGRGLLLMRTFMDEIAFNGVGNEVTMIKHTNNGTPAAVGA